MKMLAATHSFLLGAPQWSGLTLAVICFLVFLLLIGTLRSAVPSPLKWGLFGLKFLAVSLLGFFLLDPQLVSGRAKPGENIVVLLADDSASMTIRTAENPSRTRGHWAKETLYEHNAWLKQIEQQFDLRRFRFSDRLGRVDAFETLNFDGGASRLAAALNELHGLYRSQPLAAILLVSDGSSTDGLSEELEKLGVPVFPIVDAALDAPADIGLGTVTVSQTHFEDVPVTVQIPIHFSGLRPERVVVSLSLQDQDEAPENQLWEQTLPVSKENHLTARFQLKPRRRGILFYRVRVRDAAEADPFSSPSSSREATLANNERWFPVQRDSHVSRILYVGGRPNWEYKFLNRAVQSDPQVHLTGLIRIARKEAKFDFRGRAGESSNSLFRGFKSAADEETEDYSQPVLVRMNLQESSELSGGFPQNKQALYAYDAIILDDVESNFFTHDQLSLLDRFVSERGGGLLMLGGIHSFQNGKWDRTPVADALPVYLNRHAEHSGLEYTWELSREGWLEPWLRLRSTEADELKRLRERPPIAVVNPIPQIKPGARLLADIVADQGTRLPALVTQQYGQGRTAAILVGDFWRLAMEATPPGQADEAKSWRQIVRWLTGDVPQRLHVTTAQLAGAAPVVTLIQTRVKDAEYLPDETRHVTVQVTQPDGSRVDMQAAPDLDEAGLYESRFFAHQPGRHVARVSLSGEQLPGTEFRDVAWVHEPATMEFQSPHWKQDQLAELAARTGGKLIPSSQLEQFAASLPARPMPVMETVSHPFWQSPWMLLGVILLLVSEWGLRRWKGLP